MPITPKNRVKLVDIAQATGVSLTAVSLVLSDKPGISQETRNRVLEMARSLGYRFKSTVATSPVRSIKTAGLWVKSGPEDGPQDNPFYAHIISGIEYACRQADINLMVAKLPVDGDHHLFEIPALLEKGDIDATMLAGVFVDDRLEQILTSRGCPVVLVDSYSSGRAFNTILSDNLQGAYRATEYLIGMGHRQIGFVGGYERDFPSLRDRRSGYRKALADFGSDSVYFANCLPTRRDAAAAAVELVCQNGQISGLVCVNDDTAISAMVALNEQGLRVPQDISIVGFDDIYLAESVVPALTTMRVNTRSMGRLAVQLLINQVFQTEGAGPVTALFRPSLVERNSAAVFNETTAGEGRREALVRRIMADG